MSNPPTPPPPPPGPHPPTTNAALLQILTQQQQLMAELAAQVKGMSRDEVVLDSLSSNIAEFAYDPERGCTFDSWYARYADLFDKDAGKLDDAAKVRLLMRKLNPAAHERFTSFILPKTPKDFQFAVVVAKLRSIFGSPVSIFNRRFHCLQTSKDDAEDFVSYSCRVNRACVDFKISELSEEQLAFKRQNFSARWS